MAQPALVHKAADGSLVEAGQSWAYRVGNAGDLSRVTVLRVGAKRPVRVLVEFVGEAFEGRQEWVPPARLKAPWDRLDEFRAREEQWSGIRAAGLPDGDPREGPAEIVVDLLLRDDGVTIEWRGAVSVQVRDPASIAARLGLDVRQLTGHPAAFWERGVLIAPWEVTELLVTTAARLNPIPILEHVAEEERKARREAIHGRRYRGPRHVGADTRFEPELCAAVDNEYYRPRREILRSWCGAEATDRFAELAELREEVRRVGEVAQSAISALRSAGCEAEAVRLQRELGVPLETLRDAGAPG